MELLLDRTKQPITELEFAAFEKGISKKIPPEFKSFYLKNNGGAPNKIYVSGTEWHIAHFNSIKYGPKGYTIEETIKLTEDLIPSGYLPFAYMGNGWPFCIDLNEGNTYGFIYMCLMNGEDPELLTDNFQDFLDSLSEEYI